LIEHQHNIDYTANSFLQVKRPNQQYQSSEGESYKGKQPKNKENTKYTYAHTQKIAYN